MAKKKLDISLLSEEKQEKYKELYEKQEKYKELYEKKQKQKAEQALKKLETEFSPQPISSKITNISSKGIKKSFKPLQTLVKKSPEIPFAKPRPPSMTMPQRFLNSFFGGGERTFGTGQNLPKINNELRYGYGLINHPNKFETRRIFGFR
jgi:hypothetical protein